MQRTGVTWRSGRLDGSAVIAPMGAGSEREAGACHVALAGPHPVREGRAPGRRPRTREVHHRARHRGPLDDGTRDARRDGRALPRWRCRHLVRGRRGGHDPSSPGSRWGRPLARRHLPGRPRTEPARGPAADRAGDPRDGRPLRAPRSAHGRAHGTGRLAPGSGHPPRAPAAHGAGRSAPAPRSW
jgi:hypothetical protein